MPMHRPLALLIGIAGTAALAYSCSSKGSTNPPPPHTYTITKFGGDSQVGAAGTALGAVLVVYVKDERDSSVSGATVTWTAVTGGGNVASGTSLTDLDGHATIQRTLGPAAGFQTTTASLSGATGSPVTFTSISQIGGAFQIAATSGTPQTDTVLATLQPFVVTVTDYQHNPVPGVLVSFFALTGDHTSPTSAVTDGSGHASTTMTLDSVAGPKLVAATVTGLVGSPVSLNATASSGHPVSLTRSSADAQVGPVSGVLAAPLAVQVQDAHGNPVGGVTVNWTSTTGLLSAASTQSNSATGVASVTKTLGAAPGVGYDTATATGLTGSPVAFTDTAAAVVGITVGDDHFTPQFDTVAVGTFVKFTWVGAVAHTVTWNAAPAGNPQGAGAQQTGTLTVRLTDLGNYAYYCQIHGSPGAGMYGTIHTQ